MDNPFLIYVPIKNLSYKSVTENPVSDQSLYQHMEDKFYRAHEWVLLKSKGCTFCFGETKRCESFREAIKGIVSNQKNREPFDCLFITTALDTICPEMLSPIDRLMRENLPMGDHENINNIRLCYIIQAAIQSIEAQGRLYGYPFKEMEDLSTAFIDLMRSFIFNSKLDDRKIETFQRLFVELRTKVIRLLLVALPAIRYAYIDLNHPGF